MNFDYMNTENLGKKNYLTTEEIVQEFNRQTQETAYYKWLASGCETDSLTCWIEAEQEVAARWAYGQI